MAFESENDRYRRFTRRSFLLASAQGLLVTGLLGRLYYLGVVESSQYKTMAEDNRLSLRLIAPVRGKIFDRHGNPLAINQKDFQVHLIPEAAHDVKATLSALGKIVNISDQEIEKILKKISRQPGFVPVKVAENLSWETFSRVNVEMPNLPGIQPVEDKIRFYPEGPMTPHMIGYVGAPNGDGVRRDPVLQLPGFKIGVTGFEESLDDNLRGIAGTSRVEVNAYGRVVREVARQEGREGDPVTLTIDLELQRYAAKRLGDESAAVVVMDIHSGDVLAAVSTPSFDPNDFSFGISQKKMDELKNNPKKPFVNKFLSGQYPPGSTFKMVVALAALKAGVIDEKEKITCTGKIELGDSTFHCWKEEGHGRLALVNAIARSCDVYFYEIAGRVGIDRIAEMAHRLGLGETYDIGLNGQAEGLIPTRDWKWAYYGTSWQKGETLISGIGQGAVLATPLQLAVMTARLAHGAEAVNPRLIYSIGNESSFRPRFEPMNLNRKHLRLIREGMEKVHQEGGTAYFSRLLGKGMSMAGKTGTSQVRRITKEEREKGLPDPSERPWIERDHALFVGYGPVDAPRFALSVVVEHGGGGSSTAAPIGRDIMRKAIEEDPMAKPVKADLPEPGMKEAENG